MIERPSSWPEGWTEPEWVEYPGEWGEWQAWGPDSEVWCSMRPRDGLFDPDGYCAPSVVVRHLLELAEKHPNGMEAES